MQLAPHSVADAPLPSTYVLLDVLPRVGETLTFGLAQSFTVAAVVYHVSLETRSNWAITLQLSRVAK